MVFLNLEFGNVEKSNMIKCFLLFLLISIFSFCAHAQTTPNDINDVIFWYSGDSVTQDSNNKVSILHDKSGNGFNAVQNQLIHQPVSVDEHGHSTLSFDGVNHYMDC